MGYPAIYFIASIYYPVLAVVGIIVNLMAIVILSRGHCGLSKCVTRYFVGMGTADLMGVIVTDILLNCNMIYSYADFLFIHPICALILALNVATMDLSVWFTVGFTSDRFVAICNPKIGEQYCTERTATAVLTGVVAVSCARCVPFFFTVDPEVVINSVPWRCVFTSEYLTSPVWKAYELFDSIFTPLLPICLILLFNVSTVRYIILANRVRRILRNSIVNQKDPVLKNRRKSMILLFTLSANFILLWFPYVVHSMNWQVQNYSYTDKYLNTPTYILQEVGFMMKFLSTCTNTCIYTLTQRKFREELKNGLKYLFALSGRC